MRIKGKLIIDPIMLPIKVTPQNDEALRPKQAAATDS